MLLPIMDGIPFFKINVLWTSMPALRTEQSAKYDRPKAT